MINKNYLDSKSSLKKEFLKNKPFPYLVLKNFLSHGFADRLLEEVNKEKFILKDSDLFNFYQTQDDLITSKNKIVKDFYNFINTKYFKDFLEDVTGIRAEGRADASAFIYKNTHYLLPHDDRLEKRKVAYILNLSKDFTKADGGSLDLLNGKKIAKSFIPTFNTLIIFEVKAGKTFHQVSEVLKNKDRISIAGWFNDK
jgi:Rps23 Pro-64 3,4-dihydroxylase Tpa1-like proline 4-hydroxylase